MRERIRRDERGQALILVALSMVVFVGMAGLAIDVANWYQARHRAQVAADAAALAAANCMVYQGLTRPGATECTTTTDAAGVATSFAAQNGVSIPTSDVTFSSSTVTVTTPNPTPALFSGLFGIHQTRPTAVAAATWSTGTSNTCAASAMAAGECYLMFARDSNCAHNAIKVGNNGNVNIKGGLWSNSGFDSSGADNNSQWGHVIYGNGSGCSWKQGKFSPKFASGPAQHAPINAWPRDYTTIITSCVGSSTYPCTGPGGTPSYCTNVAANFSSLDLSAAGNANQVFCAYGTGTPSDPTTWNGTIIVPSSSGAFTFSDSFIGGYVSIGLHSSGTLTAQLSTSLGNLLIYANGTDSSSSLSCPVSTACTAAVQNTGGNANVTGDIFVPNGTVDIANQGNGTYQTFIQAQDVGLKAGGGLTGQGPGGGSGTSPLPGADLLIQ
jgi:Flp pilus assembly protein TadG